MAQHDGNKIIFFAIKPDGKAIISPFGGIGNVFPGHHRPAGTFLVVFGNHFLNPLTPVRAGRIRQWTLLQKGDDLIGQRPQPTGIRNRRQCEHLGVPGSDEGVEIRVGSGIGRSVAAARGEAPYRIPSENAVAGVAAVEAMGQSAATGKTVSL